MRRPDTTVIGLADARELAWCEYGDPAGRPVVGLHGTPGSRLAAALFDDAAAAAGIRIISPDRPGYGHSTFDPDRRLADFGADIEVRRPFSPSPAADPNRRSVRSSRTRHPPMSRC